MDIMAFQLSCFSAPDTTAVEESVERRKDIWPSLKFHAEHIRIAPLEKFRYLIACHKINFCVIVLDGEPVVKDVGTAVSDAAKIPPKLPDWRQKAPVSSFRFFCVLDNPALSHLLLQ